MENVIAVQTEVIDKKALSAVEQARALTISSNELYVQADNACVGLKELEKEIVATFKEPKEKAWAAHKSIVAAEAKHLDPVVEARKLYKQKMAIWSDAQEKIRRDEEERQRVAAQKAAEEEAIRLAEQAQKAGNTEEAEAIIQAPVVSEPVIVERTIPKTATVLRKVWTFKVVNAALIPRQYLTVDEVALRKQAQATGNAVMVPGVEFYQKAV